jgi:hypothetical protein
MKWFFLVIVLALASIYLWERRRADMYAKDFAKTEILPLLTSSDSWTAAYKANCIVVDLMNCRSPAVSSWTVSGMDLYTADVEDDVEWASILTETSISIGDVEKVFRSTGDGVRVLIVLRPETGSGRRIIFIHRPN